MPTGIEIGPVALGFGVVAFLLKKWWDKNESLVGLRDEAYSEALACAARMLSAVNSGDVKRANAEIGSVFGILGQVTVYGSISVMDAFRDFLNTVQAHVKTTNGEGEFNLDVEVKAQMQMQLAQLALAIRKETARLSAYDLLHRFRGRF